jgi:CubicO group peptidase (beta-lactamase class C family)
MDIQGYIIEKLSGQSLPDFMQQHIFAPLRMIDTGFFVPKEKRNRFATLYREDQNGELVSNTAGGGLPTDYATQPSMPSGGGGMLSTVEDYLRFSQMLLNGGELDGARILAPATVQLMTSNHLALALMTGDALFGPRPGLGWGYDCAVFFDPLQADEIVGKGTFFWLGAADTWFWVDPTNDLVFIGMTQRRLGPHWPDVEALSQPTVYQALLQPRL